MVEALALVTFGKWHTLNLLLIPHSQELRCVPSYLLATHESKDQRNHFFYFRKELNCKKKNFEQGMKINDGIKKLFNDIIYFNCKMYVLHSGKR